MAGRMVAATLGTIAVLGSVPAAHDMWIEPSAFVPTVGSVVGVRLRVGENFAGDPMPRDPSRIEQFVSVDASGRKPIAGRDGGDPAGIIRFSQPGLVIAGYHSRPSPVTLTAAKFNRYLEEEGLDHVIDARRRSGRTNADVQEVFSRYAKSLVLAGAPSASDSDRAIGFPFELVAERNPYQLTVGDELAVRLTYQEKPLAGTLVAAINRAAPADKLTTRTDSQGRARFRLPRAGAWLIKAVHIVPAPPDSGVEWASLWASLTFELPGGGR
jgi:uncharacterized GH25 family protein